MSSHITKPYPLTRGLSQYTKKKHHELQLNETTTLAIYKTERLDRHLETVVTSVRKILKPLLTSGSHIEFKITISKPGAKTERFQWMQTIEEVNRRLVCVLDALEILYQGLFYCENLKRSVDRILSRGQKELGEDVQELLELRKHLLNFGKFLDSVLLHYSNLNCKLPHTLVQDIKCTADEIHKGMEQLKSEEVNKLVSHLSVTEEFVLCSVLGLCDEFAERLSDLATETRQHKTDMYYLLSFIKERYESLNAQNMNDKDHTLDNLQKMGFTENRSNVIADWIAKQPFREHKSLLSWAQIYVKNLFKYDIFLNNSVSKFPYSEHCLNEWFDECVESTKNDEDSSLIPVPVINVTTEEAATGNIRKKIKEFETNHPVEKLYFHGTDHKSAANILEEGINLGKGAEYCDFSHGYGFYAADDYRYALEWTRTHKRRAVIMFGMKDDCPEYGKFDLSDHQRSRDWKSVTEYFRAGAPRRKAGLKRALLDEIDNSKCIIGPIKTEDNRWREVLQVCIKDVKIADKIGNPSNIVGVVFLNADGSEIARAPRT